MIQKLISSAQPFIKATHSKKIIELLPKPSQESRIKALEGKTLPAIKGMSLEKAQETYKLIEDLSVNQAYEENGIINKMKEFLFETLKKDYGLAKEKVEEQVSDAVDTLVHSPLYDYEETPTFENIMKNFGEVFSDLLFNVGPSMKPAIVNKKLGNTSKIEKSIDTILDPAQNILNSRGNLSSSLNQKLIGFAGEVAQYASLAKYNLGLPREVSYYNLVNNDNTGNKLTISKTPESWEGSTRKEREEYNEFLDKREDWVEQIEAEISSLKESLQS